MPGANSMVSRRMIRPLPIPGARLERWLAPPGPLNTLSNNPKMKHDRSTFMQKPNVISTRHGHDATGSTPRSPSIAQSQEAAAMKAAAAAATVLHAVRHLLDHLCPRARADAATLRDA